jgi:hypothetical protein
LSPILVRPVREQLEHDRIIRLLQTKYERKFQVSINPGHKQASPITLRGSAWYPDLLIQSSDTRPKLLGMVEVETAESVNYLEAMSQWATFARLRVPLHLYIPVSSVDSARRLCASLHISVSEIWAYNALGDEILFELVHRLPNRKAQALRASKASTPTRKTAPKRTTASRTKSRRTAAPQASVRKTAVRKAAARKATGKKRVVVRTQTPAPRKVTRIAKKGTKKNERNVAKSTSATKVAKSVRPTRTAKKASKSSRPKKR